MHKTTMSTSSSSIKLEQLLAGAQLPALPQSAICLLELSQNPDNGPIEFALPIESDPGLTGQVLRFVNSSYFGFSREIASIKLAISLVGIRTIKNFALWSAVFSLMPNPKCGPFKLKSMWQDSLRRGLFARAMGKAMGMESDAEELFSAALLQDMAVPLLSKELPEEYAKLLEVRQEGRRLSDLEQEMFGWNHAEAAGMMARSWRLPDSFAKLAETHTQLDALVENSGEEKSCLAVAISAVLPSAVDEKWYEKPRFDEVYQKLRSSHSSMPSAESLLAQIDSEFEEFAPMLKLGNLAKSLSEWYAEGA